MILYIFILIHILFFNFIFYTWSLKSLTWKKMNKIVPGKIIFFLYHISKQLLIPIPCTPLQHDANISSSKPLSLTVHIFINYNLEEMESFFEVTDKQQDIMNMYYMSEKIN